MPISNAIHATELTNFLRMLFIEIDLTCAVAFSQGTSFGLAFARKQASVVLSCGLNFCETKVDQKSQHVKPRFISCLVFPSLPETTGASLPTLMQHDPNSIDLWVKMLQSCVLGIYLSQNRQNTVVSRFYSDQNWKGTKWDSSGGYYCILVCRCRLSHSVFSLQLFRWFTITMVKITYSDQGQKCVRWWLGMFL